MKSIRSDQIDQLLEEIRSIKSVINRKKPVIQQVLNFDRFRLLMMLQGVSIILFSLLIAFPGPIALCITMGLGCLIISAPGFPVSRAGRGESVKWRF